MPELQVNGVRLYYEAHGQGPPILCVHGTGGSALMWGTAVPELARRGRVIVYDRRGCTRSQRPDPYDKTSVAEHTDDAAALLEALGPPRRPWLAAATAAASPSTWPCGIGSVSAG